MSRRIVFSILCLIMLAGTSPSWQDQATQNIIVRLNIYEPVSGKRRVDGEFRAYISGADTSVSNNHFDLTQNANTGEWESTEMEGGAEIRSGWYKIREIEGLDSTFVDRMYIYGYGLAKHAVDSDTTIATDAVTARTIAAGAVHTSELADGDVLKADIGTDAVGDDEIEDSIDLTGLTTVEELKVSTWSGEFTLLSGDSEVTITCTGMVNGGDYIILTGHGTDNWTSNGITAPVYVSLIDNDEFTLATEDHSTAGSDIHGWYLVLRKP